MWMGRVFRGFNIIFHAASLITLAAIQIAPSICYAQSWPIDGHYEPYWDVTGCNGKPMSSALFQKDSFTFFKFKETSQRENAILLKGRFQISHEKILCFDSMGNKAAVFLIPDDTLYLKLLWAFNDSCKIDTMSIGSTYVRNSKYDTSGHIEWGLVMRSFNRKTLLPSKFWVYSYYPNHDEKAKSNFKNGKLQGRQYYYTPVRSYTDSSYFMFTAIEGKWKKGRKNGTWLYYEPVVKHWGIEEFPITDIDRRPIRKELYRKGILKHSWVPK